VADLATNIGEDAVFLAEGKQIKHHAEGPSTRGPKVETGGTAGAAPPRAS
jgi:hypothetical protein